uniref:Profilin n=1 Tax=Aplanochytrium stocchinoi TaxID=215587 RepID=A0A7S3PS96_9STRA|mmetsp:Transcript_13500/g.16761  ORF Transcript_13500/g.16761 Transcript_13500/m.16761 type:complete len:172 (-) Transcript_13500:273-788(-)
MRLASSDNFDKLIYCVGGMSWQDYIDTQLVATGDVNQAFMVGITDAQVWAHTPSFMPRVYKAMVTQEDGTEKEEVINEASIIVHVAETLKKPSEGLRINGVKYMPLRTYPKGSSDDGLPTIYFKKPKTGGCICVLNQCIIVGTFDEKKEQNASACNFAVESLSRYLFQNGY